MTLLRVLALSVLVSMWGVGAPDTKTPLGFVAAFTGSDPNTAKEMARGLDIYLAAHPQIARRITVSRWDNKGDVEETLAVMRRVYDSGARIVLGIARSDEAIVAAQFAQQNKMLFVTPFATNPKVTDGKPMAFQTGFGDGVQGKALAQFASNTLKTKRALVLVNTSSVYSVGLADLFLGEWQRLNRVFDRHQYGQSQLQLEALDARIRAFKPDVVFIPEHISNGAVFAKAIYAKHPSITLLAGDGFGGEKVMAGVFGNLSGICLYYSTHWSEKNPSKENRLFVARYRKQFSGDSPTSGSALGFDAANIIGSALASTGYSSQIERIYDRLVSGTFSGATGGVSYVGLKAHAPQKNVVFIRYRNGQHEFHSTVVAQ